MERERTLFTINFHAPWGIPLTLAPGALNTTRRAIVSMMTNTSATTATLTANWIYWISFAVRRTLRIRVIVVEVTTAAAGTHTIYIYSANGTGQPRSRLASGSFDAGIAGAITITVEQPLEPGIYYIAWLAGTAAAVRALATGSATALLYATGGISIINHFFTSGTPSDPAPTSGYSFGTGALPMVGLEYVV